MSFPTHRPRRLRRTEALRNLVRETRISTSGLIYPMFACPGTKVRQPVSSMPGIAQQSVDQLLEDAREVEQLGIPGIILFGLPESKDATGSSSTHAQGIVQRAVEAIRAANLNLVVITDVCLCEYTDHGHCGVIENGEVAERRHARNARQPSPQPRPRRRRHRRPQRHDGRPRRRHSRASSTTTSSNIFRSWPTPPSTPPPSTARSATPPNPRRNSATAAAIRWIPRTPAKPCEKSRSTSTKAPTW